MSDEKTPSGFGRRCPKCGVALPASVPPDQCPRCLLQAGLPTTEAPKPDRTIVVAPPPIAASGLPKPGEQLGRYRIVRTLGEGGMGAVFAAEDLETGRRVALKILSQTLDSPEARERFLREGRLAASINHPNSVYVFGTEEIGGAPAITMELVSGGTLQERVTAKGPMPVGEAVDAVLQIIAGLEEAQRIGILHRDIKPSNCFLNADGAVKIGDFGLSISTVRIEPALTAAGAFLGTPAFSSPEQLRGEDLNVRSDMYSVGATLFFLLTGRTPFEGRNPVQLLATVLEQRAPSPRKFREDTPSGLARIVLRCLEKQPGERFKSYRELSQAFSPYSSAAPTPALLGLRFLAGTLDHFFLSFTTASIMILAGGMPTGMLRMTSSAPGQSLAFMGPFVAAVVLYYAVCEGIWGAGLGKLACGLRLVGPDRNPPGMGRAALRALLFVLLPVLPFWLLYSPNPMWFFGLPPLLQTLLGFLSYFLLVLMFATARRRNGFAAWQDLATDTRVISRAAFESRPVLESVEAPQPTTEGRRSIGPYSVLETIETTPQVEWLLAYDLRLLRKVWIRVVPPGTPPVSATLRNLGRVGRLRWLAGRRSDGENWDAYEAAGGKPLLSLAQTPQPWSQARYWLHDLARELAAANADGTMPAALSLDRIWITGDGRAKLLDFPGPGADAAGEAAAADSSPGAFLGAVSTVMLTGKFQEGLFPAVPLPLSGRMLLEQLPRFSDARAIAAGLEPLLHRPPEVTRWRRAAILAGCAAGPLLCAMAMILGQTFLTQWEKISPGVMDLNMALAQHDVTSREPDQGAHHATDRHYEIYIASHFAAVVTNKTNWTSPFAMSLIKGKDREFAEKSVADYPSPAPAEVQDADAALQSHLAKMEPLTLMEKGWFMPVVAGVGLLVYVCLPALLAALLFRGGLVVQIARVVFVDRKGARASRLRVFWRALLAWSPPLAALFFVILFKSRLGAAGVGWTATIVVCVLSLVSLALPVRGLPDRLAGTWPVPR